MPQGADFLLQTNSEMANWVFGSCDFCQPEPAAELGTFQQYRELLRASGLFQFAVGGQQPTAGWAGHGTVFSDQLTLLLCFIFICTHTVEDSHSFALSWLFYSFCTRTTHTSLYYQSICLGAGLQQVLLSCCRTLKGCCRVELSPLKQMKMGKASRERRVLKQVR